MDLEVWGLGSRGFGWVPFALKGDTVVLEVKVFQLSSSRYNHEVEHGPKAENQREVQLVHLLLASYD